MSCHSYYRLLCRLSFAVLVIVTEVLVNMVIAIAVVFLVAYFLARVFNKYADEVELRIRDDEG